MAHPREADLLARLDGLGIAWRLREHAPVRTVAEARALRGALPGEHAKNLFLKEKSGALHLAVLEEERRIRIADLGRAIGAGKLSFAEPELLRAVLDVEPGAVTPFALVADGAGRAALALDRRLAEADLLTIHPLRTDATLAISGPDFARFLAALGRRPTIVEADALEAAAG